MKIFGSISEIVSAVFRKNNQTITVRPNQPTTYTAARDVQLPPEDADSVLVSETATQTLTNKTLTSPAISTPTGLNKSDVGLSNVDNTSDATKNSASATLTNKTISGASNTITNVSLSTGVTGTLPTANGGTGQSSTATFPTAGTVAVVPASGVVKSSGTALTSGNVSLSTEVTGTLPTANGGTGQNSTATFPLSGTVAVLSDISSANFSGVLTISQGGTNNSTALTNSKVMVSVAGAIVESTITTTDLGRLSGLTSSAVGLSDSQTLTNKLISSTGLITGALTLPVGTQAERPGTPTDGMIRYNTSSGSFEGYANATWSGIGGGGVTKIITQASHGFAVGDVLYLNGSTYAKAVATGVTTAEVVGLVSRVLSAGQFELTIAGEVSGLTGLTVGEQYFLSAGTSGAITAIEPAVIGQVSVPLGVASSTTSLFVAVKRGVVIGGVNARTSISLANNATTSVQAMAAYDAAELTGWISISATTPLRFYVQAQVAKNGGGTDYNLSYQTSGQTPPTGFSMTITSAGLVQVTLPSITGFVSATINYALNAAAVGATFPLSISARNVIGDVTGTAVPSGYIGEVISGTVISTENSTTSPVQDTYYDVASPHTITLGAGVWRIVASIGQLYGDGTGTGARMVAAAIRTSTNTVITEKIGQVFAAPQMYASSGVHLEEVVNITTSTTYKISYRFRSFTGTLTVGQIGVFPSATSKLFAIRIA